MWYRRLAYLTIVLLGISGAAHAQSAPATSAPGVAKKFLEGQLVFVDLPDGAGEQWAISGSDGRLTPFNRGVKPPMKDKDGQDIGAGAIVGLNCTVDPVTGQCSYVSAADTALLAGAVAPSAAGKPISQRLLVMILDYASCGYAPSVTEASMRTNYLGTDQDGTGGIALKYEQCSYGSFTLNATAFTALIVAPNCNSTMTVNCSYSAISNSADAAAKALLGTTAFAGFTHYTYLLPPGLQSICGWAGLALLPGKQTWLQTSSYGVYRWATVMQEAIHNYGLWHSWQDDVEYNDNSTAMGRGNACPNAAEISRMGWSSAAVDGGAINSAALPIGSTSTFSLPATSLTGTGNYLRVLPNWLPSYSTVAQGKNLYLAVRVPKIGDAALLASYANNINIHAVNATMDNSYPTSYVNYDRKISFVNAVAPLTQLTLVDYNLVVYSGNWIGTDIMRVHICRYGISDTECPSLAYLEARLPPPPRPPSPSPPPPSPGPPIKGGGGRNGRRMLRRYEVAQDLQFA